MSLELEETRLTKDIVLGNIPAFPPVVLRLLDLLSNDNPDISPLVQEIASDATLSAQVLRLANSPLFGLAAQIDNVQHAVVTLGFARVQSLVATVATANYMKAALKTQALHKCWRHTLASAILCRELSPAAGIPRDRAYSLGLLHDIGRLGLLVAYPEDYNQILKAADRDAVSLLDLEKKRFGIDHCEAGRRLVEQWKLPPEFCIIAGRHHDPPAGGPVDSLTLVHLACQLADTLGYAVVTPLKALAFDEIRSALPPAARERFPDNPQVLTEIVDRAIGNGSAGPAEPVHEMNGAASQGAAGPVRAVDVPEDRSKPGLFAAWEAKPMTWDFTVVLATALVFLIVLAGGYYISTW